MNTGPTDPPPTTCPDLTVPANGMISYNMGTASLIPVDTVATYTWETPPGLVGQAGAVECGMGQIQVVSVSEMDFVLVVC